MKYIGFQWHHKGYLLGCHWISMRFTYYVARGYPLQHVREPFEIQWNPKGYVPLRISCIFNVICTCCKQYPLQPVMKSTQQFLWNPKGCPLGFHYISMKFIHCARGCWWYPCQICRNPLKFNEIMTALEIQCERILWNAGSPVYIYIYIYYMYIPGALYIYIYIYIYVVQWWCMALLWIYLYNIYIYIYIYIHT